MKKEKIIYMDYLISGYEQKVQRLLNDQYLNFINEEEAQKYNKNLKCKAITIYCKEYPNSFKLLPKPPLVVYYLGDVKLLKNNNLSIIGSRNNTIYGQNSLKEIFKNINGYTIVSGFANGIDQLAHNLALKNNLNTIAVLGGGFENIYPKNSTKLFNEIIKKNLIISEYPPSDKPKPWQFLMRNRLIAALSSKILVIEANVKSGSLSTVEVGLELSKEVYALPGSIFSNQSKGCNLLIEEGANILNESTKFIV